MYCTGKPIQLEVSFYELTDDIANLQISHSQCYEMFLKKFSLGSPKLRELSFSYLSHDGGIEFDGLHQKFPELVSISFNSGSVKNSDIDEFLKQNPQLKQLEAINCDFDDCILQSVVKYVPEIEEITRYFVQQKYHKIFWSVA